jgi:hypothetical protein
MVSHLEIRRIAALLFNCTPHIVRVEYSIEEGDDGKARYDVVEAYHANQAGRVPRGQRADERIVRTPYLSPYYDGRTQREPGQVRATEALHELISGELAQRGAA